MKKIITILFLMMMTFGMFAVDWVKYGTYETERLGTIDVYFDYDAKEPFDIKNESIRYFLFLQDVYEDVDVWLENIEDWWLYSEAIENNCYNIFIKCENLLCVNMYIHSDETVTVYTYHKENEE